MSQVEPNPGWVRPSWAELQVMSRAPIIDPRVKPTLVMPSLESSRASSSSPSRVQIEISLAWSPAPIHDKLSPSPKLWAMSLESRTDPWWAKCESRAMSWAWVPRRKLPNPPGIGRMQVYIVVTGWSFLNVQKYRLITGFILCWQVRKPHYGWNNCRSFGIKQVSSSCCISDAHSRWSKKTSFDATFPPARPPAPYDHRLPPICRVGCSADFPDSIT